ncbi:MAG: ankyrin repeat domain-containing protein [Leptospiraceae bacterium]|nr:ankyrin repeat domain-containing protein [Leptospiraceae bacterium]
MKSFFKNFFLSLFFYSFVLSADSNSDLLNSAGIGDLEGVKKSLAKKANINAKDSIGTTALMFAANNDHFQVVKFLVDNNADVLAQNYKGWRASLLAGVRANTFIQKYLEEIEKNIAESRTTGIVLSVSGDVFWGNKKLQAGDRILEKQTIYVSQNATCDLQVKQSESEFNLRLRGNSVFTFQFKEVEGGSIFSGYLKQGSMLVKVGKIFSGEKVQTLTPTSVAYFNGSSLYEVNVDSEDNSKISVLEGVIKVRIRATEIEEDEVFEKTPEVRTLVSSLENNEQVIMKGSYIDLPHKKQKEILEKANAETLYKRATTKEFSTDVIPILTLTNSEKPTIKNLPIPYVSAKEKESAGLIGIEPAKLKNASETQKILQLIGSRK